jgi:hypothetical protein
MTCPLCEIPKTESLLYQDNLLYLVKTKDPKGHDERVMACLNRHSTEPSFEERTRAYFLLYRYMKEKMEGDIWFMVGNTFASVKDHWHILACDSMSADSQELEQLHKTPKVQFPLRFKEIKE